jgi:hypothetical protein
VRSWLVESYWPPAAGSPDVAAARVHAVAGRHAVRLAGVIHVPRDEMALWRFEGIDPSAIEATCHDAQVTFERIVEVVDVASPPVPTGDGVTVVRAHPTDPA